MSLAGAKKRYFSQIVIYRRSPTRDHVTSRCVIVDIGPGGLKYPLLRQVYVM